MGSLYGFTFKKGLKEMFSQIRRSARRVPRVRKRKSGLGPFMHGDIALNGCECMVEKSTLCLVFDWVGLVKWEVQQSCMVE